jgi:hypothetical protein
MKKIFSLVINTSNGQVRVKTVKSFLDNLPRKVFAGHEDFKYETNVYAPSNTFVGSYSAEAMGPSEVTYVRKTTPILLPKDFKEMKDRFLKFLLETKEVVLSGKDFSEYTTDTESNVVKIDPANILQGIEDASVKLVMNMINGPYALIRIKPRTWCLISEDSWDMILPIRNYEDKLIGAAPVASKLGSWVIIEVERGSNVS